jgi:hypothetical protein
MDELNGIVQKTIELSRELNRTPLRLELTSAGITHYKIHSMAGLEPHKKGAADQLRKPEKITNEIFNYPIERQIEEYIPREPRERLGFSKILCWPDTHYPFHNKAGVEAMIEYAREFQPDHIVQVGDLFDMYAASKFPRSQNIYTPKEEERLAREMAEADWKKIREACPKARCHQLLGNHDVRPLKRTLESLPIMEHWVEKYLGELFQFEGVETILDTREELKIDGILFTHGFLGSGSHKDYYLNNVVHGHDHKLYTLYRRIMGANIFEMSCGFLGDIEAKALSYTPSKLANYQDGFGAIDQWGPRTIHL